jgi:LPPG:FO 2-phospho-L-lactate transferase
MEKDLVIALSGGVGGAKLALGLSRVVPRDRLMIVANTGDDFEHLGFAISPDLDTLMYTLAGLDNPETGWGRRNETWTFMAALAALGGPSWFRLGDGDLATHVERTRRRQSGETLSAITATFCHRLGIVPRILPMSDDRVRTRLATTEGWLDFQDYFVRLRCRPAISEIMFEGTNQARPQRDFLAALGDPQLRAVVICPSNPFISIEPILALRGVREALRACRAPVVAVAPIIGGQAVKGPTAKMMRELGHDVSAVAVGWRYADLLDAYIVDRSDEHAAAALDMPITGTNALMLSLEDREALARVVIDTADRLGKRVR